MPSRPLTKHWDANSSSTKAWLVGWGLLLGGIILIGAEVTRAWIMDSPRHSWNEFACAVSYSKIVSPLRFSGRLHRAAIGVRYEDGSRTYSGEWSSWSAIQAIGTNANGGYVADRAEQQRLVERYPVGRRLTCYVDPENRGNIVFDFETEMPWFGLIGGLVMLLLSGVLLITKFRLLWMFGIGERPVPNSTMDNSPIGPVSVKALTEQNHEIVFELSEGRPALGETVEINWKIPERDADIEAITLVLEGTERVVYPEPSKWDFSGWREDGVHVFFSEAHRVPAALKNGTTGHTSILIPSDLMHSFESEHHKIEWVIKFSALHADSKIVHALCPLTVRVGGRFFV